MCNLGKGGLTRLSSLKTWVLFTVSYYIHMDDASYATADTDMYICRWGI